MPHSIRLAILILLICFCGIHAHTAEPPITCLAFSPDGESVVAGSQSGVSIYSYPELKWQQNIKVSFSTIHDLHFSPNGKLLAVGGGNPSDHGSVEIVSWVEKKIVNTLTEHTDSVYTVRWLDDSTLASGALDHSILFWDIKTEKSIQQYNGHSRGVSSICFLSDHETMVSTGFDQSVRVWNLHSGELIRSLNHHTQIVNAIVPSPNVSGLPMAASAGDDRTVRFWQPTIGRMVRFARLESAPLDMAWIHNGTRIAASCKDGSVRIVDPITVNITREIRALHGPAYALIVHPTDGTIVVGGYDHQILRVDPSR